LIKSLISVSRNLTMYVILQ